MHVSVFFAWFYNENGISKEGAVYSRCPVDSDVFDVVMRDVVEEKVKGGIRVCASLPGEECVFRQEAVLFNFVRTCCSNFVRIN